MAMIVQVLSRLSRVRITLGYAAVLVASGKLTGCCEGPQKYVVAATATNTSPMLKST